MNPLQLTLVGFKGIKAGLGRDELTLDLTLDGDLIAIAGSNGAGKTTVLDNLHPYRIMPSRSSSYSAAAFSFFDHTYGVAKKMLLWEHAGITYESTIIIKGTTKTKTQECYLARVDDNGKHPVSLPNGVIADGKTKSYDECVESIIGTPEMFFTAAFSCQSRKTLADYTNGDIKGLMSELLGLDSILALSTQANDVTKSERAKLDAIRSNVGRAADIAPAIDAQTVELEKLVAATETEHATRADLVVSLKGHNRRLAEAQAAAADQAATERRRETIVAQIGACSERRDLALSQVRRHAAELGTQLRDEAKGLGNDIERSAKLALEIENRIAQNTALISEKDDIEKAAADSPELDIGVEAARKTLSDAQEASKVRADMVARLAEAQSAVRLIHSEGIALKETCQSLRARAELVDQVPCKGTDLQGRCQLLSEANAASGSLAHKDTELEAKRAARVAAAATRDALQEMLDGSPEPDVAGASGYLRALEDRARIAAHKAAKKPALDAAVAQLAIDEASLTDARVAAQAALNRRDAAAARLQAAGESLAAEEQKVKEQHDAEVTVLRAELTALPPTDIAAVTQAEQAVSDCEAGLARVDRNINTMQAEAAAHRERIAGLQRERDALAADVARAADLETEIAQWTLLAKALGNDGIVALCIDDAGPTLTALCNDLLSACYGPRFSVSIRTQEETKAGTMREVFDIIVYDAERGDEKSISDLSGGERVYVNEAMTRAIALYHAQASGRTYGCLFSDESDGALDSDKKRQFARMKRRVLDLGGYQREIYISHSVEVMESADAVIHMNSLAAA